jgi:Fe-Mn family superoxide dismutase
MMDVDVLVRAASTDAWIGHGAASMIPIDRANILRLSGALQNLFSLPLPIRETSMNVVVPPLPYAMNALEPHVSRRTLAAHYGRHHAAYVDKTRKLIESTPLESTSLESIVLAGRKQDSPSLFNAAAQAWNHTFYWSSMHPAGGGEAKGPIAELIEASFDSQSDFRQQFVAAAGDHFGSGWVWLVLDGERLKIVATANAETPLVSTQTPLLTIDVWEHAYYLDYQHRRLDYISAFMAHLVNWDFANSNLARATGRTNESRSRWVTTASAAATEIPVRGAGARR